jgi:hypothetical protein
MALLFIDGFDWFPNNATDEVSGKWQMGGTASRYDRVTNTRNSHGAAIRLESGVDMQRAMGSNLTTIYAAFAFRYETVLSSNEEMIEFVDSSTTQCFLRLNTGGSFEFMRSATVLGTGSLGTNINTWYHLAMKVVIDNTVGSFELRINGGATPDINVSGVDTQSSVNAYANNIEMSGSPHLFSYDDMVLADDTGSQAFLGDYDIYTIHPDGAGASAQFTPSAGSNWQNVDENPNDGDTTYNESSTAGHKDRFTMGDVPADTGTIYGVQVSAFAKKTDVGTREIKTVAFDGTTEGSGATYALSTTYTWFLDMYEDHPSGAAAWTESEVNSMQAGYEVVS